MHITKINSFIRKYNTNSKPSFKGIKVVGQGSNRQEFSNYDPRPWATQILQTEGERISANEEKDGILKARQEEILRQSSNLSYPNATYEYDGKDIYDKQREILGKTVPMLRAREVLADKTLRIAKDIRPKIDEAEKCRRFELIKVRVINEIESQKIKRYTSPGMSKVAGYEHEQDVLHKVFIDKVAEEKAGQDIDIAGSILFFGPYGNGKTHITQAIADETGCRIVPIRMRSEQPESQEKAMQKILDTAQEAEAKFQNDRTRTIIFVDELEKLTNNNPNGVEKFKEFLRTCSKEYHCTVFAATNHPLKLALDPKDTDIFPIRVSIDPPNLENASKVFKHYLTGATTGEIDYNLLASNLIGQGDSKKGKYNNQQIKNICNAALAATGGSVTQKDVLKFIELLEENPVINQEMMQKFQQEYETFIQTN